MDKYVACNDDGRPMLTLFDRKALKEYMNSPFHRDHEFIDETKDKKKKADLSGAPGSNDGEKLRNAMLMYSIYRGRVKFGYFCLRETDEKGKAGKEHEKLIDAGAEKVYSDSFLDDGSDRVQLEVIKQLIRPRDTLIIPELVCLADKAEDAAAMINQWNDHAITVNVLNFGVIDGTETGQLIRKVMNEMSRFGKHSTIEEPEKSTRKRELSKGGRPRINPEKLEAAMQMINDGASIVELSKKVGISQASLYRYWRTWKPTEEYPKEEHSEIPGQIKIVDIDMHTEEES